MKRSTLVLCMFISVGHAFWRELGNVVPDVLNPIKLLHSNRCIDDLGCFYTGAPFFHVLNRPISLPPTSNPDVKFQLFTPNNPKKPYELWPTKDSLHNSFFNSRKPTKILIHGFMADLDFNSIRYAIKNALLKEGSYNVIVVDWTSHNGPPYAQAVANTRVVGAATARLVSFLTNATRIRPQNIHIIGHSLGAHTAGYAGERIPNLGRITGLDPAGPYFQDAESEVRLDTTDALFVDVIHTDGGESVLGGLGISQAIGHMDFYPNGGKRQPGCGFTVLSNTMVGSAIDFTTHWVTSSCNHLRSRDLYMESVLNAGCRFKSVHCSSYADFENGSCLPENSTSAEMGYHVKRVSSLAPPAKFFLRTNDSSPFCIQ